MSGINPFRPYRKYSLTFNELGYFVSVFVSVLSFLLHFWVGFGGQVATRKNNFLRADFVASLSFSLKIHSKLKQIHFFAVVFKSDNLAYSFIRF